MVCILNCKLFNSWSGARHSVHSLYFNNQKKKISDKTYWNRRNQMLLLCNVLIVLLLISDIRKPDEHSYYIMNSWYPRLIVSLPQWTQGHTKIRKAFNEAKEHISFFGPSVFIENSLGRQPDGAHHKSKCGCLLLHCLQYFQNINASVMTQTCVLSFLPHNVCEYLCQKLNEYIIIIMMMMMPPLNKDSRGLTVFQELVQFCSYRAVLSLQ